MIWEVKPTDIRLIKTSRTFKWASETCAGMPVLCWLDGSICEPILFYFGYCFRKRIFKKISSMGPAKSSLRRWLAMLENLNASLDKPSDELFHIFRESYQGELSTESITEHQIEKNIHHVFEFYRLLPFAMPLLRDGEATPTFVGQPGDETAPITSKFVAKEKYTRWASSVPTIATGARRPDPDDDQVDRILSHLRTSKDKKSTVGGSDKDRYLRLLEGERNWIIARCEAHAALRTGETAWLSLWHIGEAFLLEGILVTPNKRRFRSGVNPLIKAIIDPILQSKIIAGLHKLSARGRTCIDIKVKGKSGLRMAPFPIALVMDILNILVWTGRKKISEVMKSVSVLNNPYVFISSKTLERLETGSVGDIVNDVFKELEIAGSSHRLRAYALTNMAWLIWNENFATNGYIYDQALVNMTLDRVAEAAGHKNPSTTDRYYVSRARLRHVSKRNRKRIGAANNFFNTLMLNLPTLDDATLVLLERSVLRLAGSHGSVLAEILNLALDDLDSEAREDAKSSTTATELRLVVDNDRQ